MVMQPKTIKSRQLDLVMNFKPNQSAERGSQNLTTAIDTYRPQWIIKIGISKYQILDGGHASPILVSPSFDFAYKFWW